MNDPFIEHVNNAVVRNLLSVKVKAARWLFDWEAVSRVDVVLDQLTVTNLSITEEDVSKVD